MGSNLLRTTLVFLSCAVLQSQCSAQVKPEFPEDKLTVDEMAAHLRFIASDKLMGRMTGKEGNNEAARYIAGEFRKAGIGAFPSAGDFFQNVPLHRRMPPGKAVVVFNRDTLHQPDNVVLRDGGPMQWKGQCAFVGYGIVDSAKGIDDFNGIDVKGKVVIARLGKKGDANLFSALTELAAHKRLAAKTRGAVALIEFYEGPREWRSMTGFLMRSGVETGAAGRRIPHFIVEDTSKRYATLIQSSNAFELAFQTEGVGRQEIPAQNVLGYIRGADPKLREEYVLLTAHYDHVGTGKPQGATGDTIYNGARDNGMGTVALIGAAKALAAHPPKRSVIIAAVTGEEMGLLGSRYLASEPPVPMSSIVFNLNIDGAGYDDTTLVTVVGLERTTAEPFIRMGAERYGLAAMREPEAQKGLFNASDNVSFAALGVPAPTFSEGFHGFTPEILKYYHQAADQADENFNFSYFLKFCKAYVHAVRLIADAPVAPFWKPGDPYEQIGKSLYHKN